MKRKLRNHIRELRQQGLSLGQISRITVSPIHTIKHWVRDIVLSEEVLQSSELSKRYRAQLAGANANREKHRDLRRQYQEQGRIKARTGKSLHLTGSMLYWAEGGKGRNQIIFVNSDPSMMLLFLRFCV